MSPYLQVRMEPSLRYYLRALQLYKKSIENPYSPFWRFVAAADYGEEGWRLLINEAARLRGRGFRTKLVSMPLSEAAYEIHKDYFAVMIDITEWETRSPYTGNYSNEWRG